MWAKLKIFKRAWTVWLLIGVAAGLILWDVFADPTESSILAGWSRYLMCVPWSLGMLVGHWTWNVHKRPAPDAVPWKIAVNFGFLALLIAWDVASYYGHPVVAQLRHGAYFAPIGYLFGHFFWGQGD